MKKFTNVKVGDEIYSIVSRDAVSSICIGKLFINAKQNGGKGNSGW